MIFFEFILPLSNYIKGINKIIPKEINLKYLIDNETT